ncbi:TPA: site-2 protease family protein [Thermoplasmata archaeon]|nr:site-2 protease family protein [Thermoplasmata archaeon]
MLIITLLTVTFTGTTYRGDYAGVPGAEMFSLENIATGIAVFALPLFAIIGAHELAHYYAARRRKIAASLPFFIPSIPPFGTFGAFISLRDPIPSSQGLLEVGVAGPIAGLLVAIPVCVIGLMLTNSEARLVPDDIDSVGSFKIGVPIIFSWILEVVPLQGDYIVHPTAFAAWVGFWVTAINLLPAAQLDGGHISRALLGGYAKYASWATIAILIALSFIFTAWIILVILILILGIRHPPPLNDITKLDMKRKIVGVFAFVILLLVFIPIPMWISEADHSFDMEVVGAPDATIAPGETYTLSFHLVSQGNVMSNITIAPVDPPDGWTVMVRQSDSGVEEYHDTYSFILNTSDDVAFEASITAPGSVPPGNTTVVIGARALATDGEVQHESTVSANITVTTPALDLWLLDKVLEVPVGGEESTSVQVNNTGEASVDILLLVSNLPPMVGAVLYVDELDENSTISLNLTVPAHTNVTFSIMVFASSMASPGDATVYLAASYFSLEFETIEIPITIV